MSLSGEQVLLRIYLDSADRAPFTPTSERIVKAARHAGLAGATVLRGILGFGPRGIARPTALGLVQHAPVIVEIVDSAERIAAFIDQQLETLLVRGLATLERAHVMMYRPGKSIETAPMELGGPIEPLSTLPQLKARQTMQINEDGVLLRVFIGESDRHDGRPLYEAIVHAARQHGLAGATVLRGVEGFGANSVVHKASLLELSSDLPIVIEMVDARERVQAFLPELEAMVKEGLVTMEHVATVLYRHNPDDRRA